MSMRPERQPAGPLHLQGAQPVPVCLVCDACHAWCTTTTAIEVSGDTPHSLRVALHVCDDCASDPDAVQIMRALDNRQEA